VNSALNALKQWPLATEATLRPITSGLINQTFVVEGPENPIGIFQRLNTAIFSPRVHEDIEAVTTRLEAAGLTTPRLIPTSKGDLWYEDPDGAVWRAMSFHGNRTIERVTDRKDAFSAGKLIAAFHAGLNNLNWEFRSVRPGAHDTRAHMEKLARVIPTHREHRLWAEVKHLGETILDGWSTWQGHTDLPTRIIHGDLKISNIRYQDNQALCLIDLDTLAVGTLDVELGDALRSWCNPAAENTTETAFDLDIFQAAMSGYAEGCAGQPPQPVEWDSIVGGTERICWELAARFAADALEECYFGFDDRFGGRGEHNLLRAQGQATLAQSVRGQREEAETLMTTIRPSA
jgi:Ser/Thr protein kinase RdoA (MazF antagonist)